VLWPNLVGQSPRASEPLHSHTVTMPNDIRSKYKCKNCNKIKRTDTHFPHLLAKNEKGEPKQGQRALHVPSS
jgi:hypothetical protein